MTKSHAIILAISAAALLFVGGAWLRAHDAWIHFQATSDAQETVRKHADADANAAAAHSVAVGKTEQKQVQQIQHQAAQPLSSDQVRALVQKMLPRAQVQEITTPQGQFIAVPDTQQSRDELQQQKAACDICAVRLAAREQQYADAQAELKAKDESIAALKLERDAATAAAKHGRGFFANLKHDAIMLGIGAGAGYALHRSGK